MSTNRNEEKKNLFKIVRDNLQKLTIAIVSIVYITQGIFELAKKETTILDILGNIGLSVVIGMIISSNLNVMGLKDGRLSETFLNSMRAYGDAKKKASPYSDKLSAWCDYKNAQELEMEKKSIIQEAGLNWKAYKFGYYEDHREHLGKEQISALFAAKHCKIAKLKPQELLSDLPKNRKGIFKPESKFGESELEYKRRNGALDLLSKVMTGVVCGMYTLSPLITQENKLEVLSGVIWNAMQIAIWLTFGILKYVNAKNFMIDEYRQTHIIQKTEYLNEFVITIEKNPKVIEEYTEDIEIDKYIEEYLRIKENNLDNEQKTILD